MKGIKKILVHKEGQNWIANDNGVSSVLPNRLVTVEDVQSYFEDVLCLVPYMLIFV